MRSGELILGGWAAMVDAWGLLTYGAVALASAAFTGLLALPVGCLVYDLRAWRRASRAVADGGGLGPEGVEGAAGATAPCKPRPPSLSGRAARRRP
jgi:hypothetical protein